MPKLLIRGGKKISGKIRVNGAKNAALPIMAACILVKGEVILKRVPDISDVWVMADILRSLGAEVDFEGKGEMRINTDNVSITTAPYELVKQIHASFDITGPLLARFNKAEVHLPGGCVIGTRAVDLHIEGFGRLGAEVDLEHGILKAKSRELKGTRIYFPKSSVGATKNVMMAACLAKGRTILENSAREPEVADLAGFLVSCGARISGIGTSNLEIEGVKSLKGTEYSIISDRIEAGTYLFASVITEGDIFLEDIDSKFLESVIAKIESTGQKVEKGENWLRLKSTRPVRALEITTAPFPGFPTDLQPPLVSVLTMADGTSIIEETIFDGRFNYVDELRRMGADIRVYDKSAVVKGVKKLTGAPVDAMDIRAGGALVLAGLAADGQTEIGGIEYIDRGYEKIEERLASLGADIKRI